MPGPPSVQPSAVFAALLLLVLQSADGAAWQDTARLRGVVVEDVAQNSVGESAGIRPGDVLLSWVRAASPPTNPAEARGQIGSPFDLTEIEIEEAPRGTVTLTGIRNGQSFSAALSPGEWKINTRPQMSEASLAAYQRGRQLVASNDVETGTKTWKEAATTAQDFLVGYWLSLKAADALAAARRWDEADAAYREAIAIFESKKPPEPPLLAYGWEQTGAAFQRRNQWPAAEAAFRQALQIRERRAASSLGVAHDLHLLGVLARSRGDRQSAGPLIERALQMRTQLAPDSLPVAASLNLVGTLAGERGDFAAAEEPFTRSLRIRERLAPESLDVATSLSGLGVVATRRGDLVAAEALHRRSLAIKDRLAPASISFAVTLNGLGGVAWERGDLAAAEDFYRRALVIHEKLDPNGTQIATIVRNLGRVARQRGDLPLARNILQRALVTHEKRAPESLDVAAALSDLGAIALDSGDMRGAQSFHTRALALRERLASGTVLEAISLNNLGEVARLSGDLKLAREFQGRALRIREKVAPGSLDVATSLSNLARIAEDDGDRQTAQQLHTRALPLYRALAPGSAPEARTLYRLGSINREASRPAEASRYFDLAIQALESQVGRLGGAEETRSSFAAEHTTYYREFSEVLVELDQAARAFEVLERSRARSLLAMLAERDLSFKSDVPPELERERRQIAAEYDRTQAAMARLDSVRNTADLNRLQVRLGELRDQREAIAQRVRQASPRFASLQYPQTLDVTRTRQVLDAGTVLLWYSVGRHETILFVLQPIQQVVRTAPGLSVFRLPVGSESLRDQIVAFRNLIQRQSGDSDRIDALEAHGRKLFDALIKPAEQLITGASRVVISPDGPLHTLPFGALVLPPSETSGAKAPRYFIEWKPIHSAISATVYAELKKARRPAAPPARATLIAFADPSYPAVERDAAGSIADADVRAAVRSGYTLAPLPASRAEVSAIAKIYGNRAVSYVGPAATEERAKTLGRTVRYVHFATHGLLDEGSPLNSALALTIPDKPGNGRDNGLLQAWEIFEQIRLDTDLVTLSACESALGRELGGEGLVGLTRAFQYAGARSVLASLWSVADESTAILMTRFYQHLKAGKSKDAALRAAQLDLIHSARAKGASNRSHPFHWAAFTLSGDWK